VLTIRLCLYFFFFFSSRRRHTRFSRDWSSDVCSSDLGGCPPAERARPSSREHVPAEPGDQGEDDDQEDDPDEAAATRHGHPRAEDRKSVVEGKSGDPGGPRTATKNKQRVLGLDVADE